MYLIAEVSADTMPVNFVLNGGKELTIDNSASKLIIFDTIQESIIMSDV